MRFSNHWRKWVSTQYRLPTAWTGSPDPTYKCAKTDLCLSPCVCAYHDAALFHLAIRQHVDVDDTQVDMAKGGDCVPSFPKRALGKRWTGMCAYNIQLDPLSLATYRIVHIVETPPR